ncbi:acylneuraminate cytidylyltransferase family protein [Pseudodesulfovibrio sp.]|nr:acylneuraminate cytidylyltransferase family protein [Pseudodesulfovibrio sp.]
MKTYGFIFARGGSKGVPGKNIKMLGGKPLIAWSIDAGKESGLLERIIVSTDDEEIAEVAREYGAEVPFMRPAELASDTAPEWLAWQHAIEAVDPFDIFVSLPATSPLRTVNDVVDCVELYKQGDCDMVITAYKASHHPSYDMVYEDENGHAQLVLPPDKAIHRRQDTMEVLNMTTIAYVTSPEFVLNHDSMYEGRMKTVVVPEERGVEIDTMTDFALTEFWLSRRDGNQ